MGAERRYVRGTEGKRSKEGRRGRRRGGGGGGRGCVERGKREEEEEEEKGNGRIVYQARPSLTFWKWVRDGLA